MFFDAIIEPLQKTFDYKGCKITALIFFFSSANFALLAGFFCCWCYSPHWSRDAGFSPIISPLNKQFFKTFGLAKIERIYENY